MKYLPRAPLRFVLCMHAYMVPHAILKGVEPRNLIKRSSWHNGEKNCLAWYLILSIWGEIFVGNFHPKNGPNPLPLSSLSLSRLLSPPSLSSPSLPYLYLQSSWSLSFYSSSFPHLSDIFQLMSTSPLGHAPPPSPTPHCRSRSNSCGEKGRVEHTLNRLNKAFLAL